jgi:integrase
MPIKKYKVKNGFKYEVRVNFTDPISGKYLGRKERGFESVKEAKTREAELLHSLANNGVVNPSKMTVREHCEEWFASHSKTLEKSAENSYRQHLNAYIYPALGHIPLKKLSHAQCQSFCDNLVKVGGGYGGAKRVGEPLATKTRLCIHGTLHHALGHAVRLRRIEFNPADYCTFKKQAPKLRTAFTPEQLDRVLQVCESDDRWNGIIRLFFFSGMRTAELLGMSWNFVNLEKGFAHVFKTRVHVSGVGVIEKPPKTNAGIRKFSIDAETVEALKRWQTFQKAEAINMGAGWLGGDLATCYLLTKPDGSPVHISSLRRKFKAIAKEAGIPAKMLHESRYTSASLGQKHFSPTSNQRRLGHSSPIMTDHYTNVFDEHDREGVERMAEEIRQIRRSGK